MWRKHLKRVGTALAIGCGGLALPAGATDATTADIDGVRLYMSADEAVSALRQRFGKDILVRVVHMADKLDTTIQIVQSLDYLIDGKYTLTVRFAPRVPPEPARPDAAFAIVLVMSHGGDADKMALQGSIQAKFGTTSGPGWCDYDDSKPCLRVLDGPDYGIELVDTGYEKKSQETAEKPPEIKAPL